MILRLSISKNIAKVIELAMNLFDITKGLFSRTASAKNTVQLEKDKYKKLCEDNPDIEPHKALYAVYRRYVEVWNVFPNRTPHEIELISYQDTGKLSIINNEDERAYALGLLLLFRSRYIDGGRVNSFPDFYSEYSRVIGPIEKMLEEDSQHFWGLYCGLNPKMYSKVNDWGVESIDFDNFSS